MSSPEQTYVGGQAVIEGVMMRAPRCMAVAVRRADGTIVVREDGWVSIWERWGFLRWPGLRGSVVLAESVYNGLQALNFAADQALISTTEDPRAADGQPSSGAPHGQVSPRPADGQPSSGATTSDSEGASSGTTMTMVMSFALAIALFVGLPHLLAWGAGRVTGAADDVDAFAFHVFDGVFKLAIFIAYIAGISLIPEIRRVFQYHGAEHKVVNVYENGLPVTLENARRFTTFHARCGTSFVLFVLVLSIFMFAAIFPLVPRVSNITVVNHIAVIFIKIPLMLPLAGIAYEINRYAARHPDLFWVQMLVVPGRLMQRLTTREPDDDQLEIAIAAMRAALRRETEIVAEAPDRILSTRRAIAVYRDFEAVSDALPVGSPADLATAPVH